MLFMFSGCVEAGKTLRPFPYGSNVGYLFACLCTWACMDARPTTFKGYEGQWWWWRITVGGHSKQTAMSKMRLGFIPPHFRSEDELVI